MDCSTRIYHQNDYGYTKQCTCQGMVHLNFGNVSLLLTNQQVKDFAFFIEETILVNGHVFDPNERCVYIPTRDFCLMFAMTCHELQSLSDILHHTLLMIEVDDALSRRDGGH